MMTSASTETPASLSQLPNLHDSLPPGSAKVVLKLFGQPDRKLLGMARVHYDAIEQSDFYEDPSPPQEELAECIEAFEESCMEVMSLRTDLAAAMEARKTQRRKLEQAMNRRGNYVQSASLGNPARITHAALRVQKHRSRVGRLPAVEDVRVTPGTSEGEVLLTWGKVRHARLYILQHGPEGGPMVDMVLTGRRKHLMKLPPLHGTAHVFRIAAAGSSGLGGYSPWVKWNPW